MKNIIKFLSIPYALILFSCAPIPQDAAMSPQPMIHVVMARDVTKDHFDKTVTVPTGVTNTFSLNEKVIAYMSFLHNDPYQILGRQPVEVLWYNENRLVLRKNTVVNFNNPPYQWFSISAATLGAGNARFEAYSNGNLLGSQDFVVSPSTSTTYNVTQNQPVFNASSSPVLQPPQNNLPATQPVSNKPASTELHGVQLTLEGCEYDPQTSIISCKMQIASINGKEKITINCFSGTQGIDTSGKSLQCVDVSLGNQNSWNYIQDSLPQNKPVTVITKIHTDNVPEHITLQLSININNETDSVKLNNIPIAKN